MRLIYPSYYSTGTEFIFNKLPAQDKKDIKDFCDYCRISAGEKKVRVTRATVLQFLDIVEKPISKIELKDLRGYLAVLNSANLSHYTKNDVKKYVKKLLRWKFKDWSERFDDFKDVKGVALRKAFNHTKVNENTLVTKEELEKLLRTAQTLKWKAILTFLYETGCRPQELRNLKWKHLRYNDDGADVTLFSNKTEESRTIPIKDCVVHLRRWEQEYQFELKTSNDYIFPNAQRGILSDNALPKQLKVLCREAGIRFIHPYLLRHTRLTSLYNKIPEQIVKKYAGHSPDSKMPSIYSHISNKDVRDVMLEKIYNIKELSPEKKHELELELQKVKAENRDIRKSLADFGNKLLEMQGKKGRVELVNT